MIPRIVKLIPEFLPNMHKGQAGKFGIVGGSKQYTGAPYFSAYSAIKMGMDLSTVFCTEEAAIPIKCYSPELMVHPIIKSSTTTKSEGDKQAVENSIAEVKNWLPRLSVLVVGPGLGKDPLVLETAAAIMHEARGMGMPILVDADALALVPKALSGYTKAIITPNAMEFRRLWEAVISDQKAPDFDVEFPKDKLEGTGWLDPQCDLAKHTSILATRLGGLTIVRKGRIDLISNGTQAAYCSIEGTLRRTGGQGDILTGAIGAFFSWATDSKGPAAKKRRKQQDGDDGDGEMTILAAVGGCTVLRTAAHQAWQLHGRGMTSIDVITALPKVLDDMTRTSQL